MSDYDSTFVSDLTTALSGTGVTIDDVYASYYDNDVWLQDEVEVGYSRWPNINIQVVWDLPRDRGLDDGPVHYWPEDELLCADFGHFTEGTGSGSENYGGNIDVTPPITVGGTSYDLGIVVAGTNIGSSLENFVKAQNVQVLSSGNIVKCDTTWLDVGHIDEVISFIPDGAGFKVLIADTDAAMDILEGMNEHDSGTAESGSSNTLIDNDKSWTTDKWKDGFIEITSGTGAGQVRKITSNNSTTITVSPNWTTSPDNSTGYEIVERSAYRAMFFEGDEDYGVATGGTNNTLSDSTKNWTGNKWQNGYILIADGSGSGQFREILSNGADYITASSNWTTNPDATSRYVLVEKAKTLWSYNGSWVAFDCVRHLLANNIWMNFMGNCQNEIDSVRSTLNSNLGLSPGDYIEIPVLFYDYNWNYIVQNDVCSWMPNMVNSLICGNTIVISKPFGPKNPSADVFEDDVKTKLALTVEFVDDWETYHKGCGEIHCGTNVKRTPSSINWWD